MTLPPPPQPPDPLGQPQYPQYPVQPYDQPQYPHQPPPGYGYPGYPPPPPGYAYGYPQPQPARLCLPASGWALLVASGVAVLGSITPWVTVHFLGNITVDGTEGDGKLTIVCAFVTGVMGLLIGIGLGKLWTGIVAVVFAAFIVLIALIDLGNISRLYGPAEDAPDDFFSVGYGLWLVIAGGLFGLAASIVALVRRPIRA